MHAACKFLRSLSAALALILLSCMSFNLAFAQETTGGLEGVVKDPQGAVIANANIVLTGDKLIGTKTIHTDGSGYYRFVNIDPGTYTLTVTSASFNELKRTGIQVVVGRLPTIDLSLSVGSDRTIVEVTAATPQIDVTESRTQTTVSKDEIDYAPRGRSFESVLAFAPGARNEPLQGGFQIDGASTAENSYLIEGQETGSLVTGKATTSAPFEFIQEVQIKTSGIDAENGGAMGGVVNAIQKRGGKIWHGSVFTYYEADPFDAGPAATLRYDPLSSYTAASRSDQGAQFYTPKKDHFRTVEPGF